MDANEYQKSAMRFLNPELDKDRVLCNAVMGLCGESGEVIDLVKKHFFQGHELDRGKMAEELGDVAWYLAETCEILGLNLSDVLQGNIEKLAKRYPDGFSSERSIHRN